MEWKRNSLFRINKQKSHKNAPRNSQVSKSLNVGAKGNRNKLTEAVMNVPHTPGSKLRQMLTEMERGLRINSQVKYSEEFGSTLVDLLVRSEVGCGRVDCFPCKSKKGNCLTQVITYGLCHL